MALAGTYNGVLASTSGEKSSSEETTSVHFQFDGGAMRGYVVAKILAQLEQDLGRPVYRMVGKDGSVMGVSVGGIIGAALTVPGPDGRILTAAELVQFFRQHGPGIFGEVSTFIDANSSMMRLFGLAMGGEDALPKLLAPKGKTYLQEQLEKLIPGMMNDAQVQLQLLAHRKSDEQKYFFDSARASQDASHNTKVSAAALASASLVRVFGPTPVQFQDATQATFVDAGDGEVPNPVVSAVKIQFDMLRAKDPTRKLIVSFGTGFTDAAFVGDETVAIHHVLPDYSGYQPKPSVAGILPVITGVAEGLSPQIRAIVGQIPTLVEIADTSDQGFAHFDRVAERYLSSESYQVMRATLVSVLPLVDQEQKVEEVASMLASMHPPAGVRPVLKLQAPTEVLLLRLRLPAEVSSPETHSPSQIAERELQSLREEVSKLSGRPAESLAGRSKPVLERIIAEYKKAAFVQAESED